MRWKTTTRWVAMPLRALPAGLPQLRGRRDSRRPLDPHFDVRTSRWIYPNLFGPDTTCHSLAPFVAWKSNYEGRPHGTRPLPRENQLVKLTTWKHGELCRAVSHSHSRKCLRSTAPAVPSTSSRGSKVACSFWTALVIPQLVHPPRHLCDQRRQGHDLVRVLLAQPRQAWKALVRPPYPATAAVP